MEKIAFVFPGQGSQFIGMGKSFYQSLEIVRQTYEEAGDYAGFDIAKLCFEGSMLDQNRIDKMQFAVVTTDVAIARAFTYRYGVTPQFCAGHSVGEYAALVCSGAVRFSDAIKILKVRGVLLKSAIAHKLGQMSIIEKVSEDTLRGVIQEDGNSRIYISCFNSSDQFAICGENVERVEEKLLEKNARITPVIASPPIHCPLMSEAAEGLFSFLGGIKFYSFRAPIVANVTGSPFSEPSGISEIMSKQLNSPVQWSKTVRCFEKYGISMVVEMGPKKLLTSFLEDMNPDIKKYCYGIKADCSEIDNIFQIDESLQRDKALFLDRCLGIAVSVQNHNDNPEEFKAGVVDNYNHIKQLSQQVQESGCPAGEKEMREGIQLLKKILQTKKASEQEQQDWLKQLLDETSTCYTLKEFAL